MFTRRVPPCCVQMTEMSPEGNKSKALPKSKALVNPSSWGINIVDAPLSGAWHVLWGPTGTPWGRAEGCNF